MDDTLQECPETIKHIILGDLNARLHGIREDEEGIIGPYVFGKGVKYLERKQIDRLVLNRDLLSDVARDNGLSIMNTWFKKPDSKLISYRIPGTVDLKIINPQKFATTDHILCKKSHKHIMLDVETDTITAIPSDHFPMICTIKNMVYKNKNRPTMGAKYCDPSKEEKENFNKIFKGEMAGKIKYEGEHETEEEQNYYSKAF